MRGQTLDTFIEFSQDADEERLNYVWSMQGEKYSNGGIDPPDWKQVYQGYLMKNETRLKEDQSLVDENGDVVDTDSVVIKGADIKYRCMPIKFQGLDAII